MKYSSRILVPLRSVVGSGFEVSGFMKIDGLTLVTKNYAILAGVNVDALDATFEPPTYVGFSLGNVPDVRVEVTPCVILITSFIILS